MDKVLTRVQLSSTCENSGWLWQPVQRLRVKDRRSPEQAGLLD